jgi:hypothetical protein
MGVGCGHVGGRNLGGPAVRRVPGTRNVKAGRAPGWCSICERGKRRPVVVVMLIGKTKITGERSTAIHETRLGICLPCAAFVQEVAKP